MQRPKTGDPLPPAPAADGHGDGPADEPRGLPAPGRSTVPIAIAVTLGGMWGLVGYSVLWEGQPFEVSRAFVNSIPGLLTLLPVRLVIWGIRLAEQIEGRTFDLSSTNLWIAPVASILGAAIALGVVFAGRTVAGRLTSRRVR
jgi:hypothetical protein